MKHSLRKTLAVVLSLSAVLSFTGCSKSQPTPAATTMTTAAAETKGSTSETASNEKVELSFMNFFVEGDGRYSLSQKTMEDYKAANPNVTLKAEGIAHDLYVTKVQTLGISGGLPDVFFMKGVWAADFVKAGSIQPCDDMLASDPEWKDNFSEGALANHYYNGKIYSLPFTIDLNSILYYNDDLFKKYNVKVPQTWDEMLTAVDTFNKNGIIPMALGNKDQWLIPTASLSCFTALYGGADYMNKLCYSKDAKYTDEPYIKALNALVTMVDKKAFNPDFNSIDNYQMYGIVGQGKAAMFIAGSWAAQTFLETAAKEVGAAVKATFIPAFPDGAGEYKTVAGGSGWGLQINPNLTGAKREAAIKLVKAYTDKNFAKNEIELASIVPAVKNYEYDKSKITPLFNGILDIAKEAKLTPVFDQVIDVKIGDVMNKTSQAVMAHGMKPEEAAKSVQEAKDKVIK